MNMESVQTLRVDANRWRFATCTSTTAAPTSCACERARPARQHHRAAGPQRRGQDHAAQEPDGPGADQERHHQLERQAHPGPDALQRARSGIGFVPQGARSSAV
jgi:hypothetical protein